MNPSPSQQRRLDHALGAFAVATCALLIASANAAIAQTSAQVLLFPGSEHVGPGPQIYVSTGDFDGDGRADVAGTSGAWPTVACALGVGNGSFGALVASPAASVGPFGSADLDGDGRMDLYGTAVTSNAVRASLGQGDATFTDAPAAAVPHEPIDFDAGDLDGDGHPDLVVSTQSLTGPSADVISVLLGTGDGSFVLSANVAAGEDPYGVALMDLNEDGVLDLAAADEISVVLRTFIGIGDGTFAPGVVQPVSGRPRFLAAADFDGDGHADVAVSAAGQGASMPEHVAWFPGDGTGALGSTAPFAVGWGGFPIAAADFDADGAIDLAGSAWYFSAVLLRNSGGGAFASPIVYVGRSGYGVSIADLNGDQLPDLVCAVWGGFAVLLAGADGTLLGAPATLLPGVFGTPPFATRSPHVADFDGDGIPDLATTEHQPKMHVLLGTGADALGPPLESDVIGPRVAMGDLDLNGTVDLVASGSGVAQPLLGKGDGTFEPGVPDFAGGGASPGLAADLDGDGLPDLALPVPPDFTAKVLLNVGHVTFAPPSIVATGKFRVLVGADLDRDGDLELILGEDLLGGSLFVLDGHGDGTFAAPSTSSLTFVEDLDAVDYNGDGYVDVVAARADIDEISLLRGSPSGALASPAPLVAGQGAFCIAVADLDGDGELDLAGTQYELAYLVARTSVWFGKGGGALSGPSVFSGAGGIAVADFDLDGRLDFAGTTHPYSAAYLRANLAQAPGIESIGGLAAAASGQAVVHGSSFDGTTQVLVDGSGVQIQVLGPDELALALSPDDPGAKEVQVVGTFGTTTVPDALARWPVLAAGPAAIGLPLAIEMETGSSGPFALVVSVALLATPVPIAGIHHALWLDSAVLLKVGATPPGATATTLAVQIPNDPVLSGATVHLQAWAWLASLAVVPPSSFSNHIAVSIQ